MSYLQFSLTSMQLFFALQKVLPDAISVLPPRSLTPSQFHASRTEQPKRVDFDPLVHLLTPQPGYPLMIRIVSQSPLCSNVSKNVPTASVLLSPPLLLIIPHAIHAACVVAINPCIYLLVEACENAHSSNTSYNRSPRRPQWSSIPTTRGLLVQISTLGL